MTKEDRLDLIKQLWQMRNGNKIVVLEGEPEHEWKGVPMELSEVDGAPCAFQVEEE